MLTSVIRVTLVAAVASAQDAEFDNNGALLTRKTNAAEDDFAGFHYADLNQGASDLARQLSIEPPEERELKEVGAHHCKACVLRTGKAIMEKVKSGVDKYCKNEVIHCHECRKKKYFCHFWHDKPEVAFGFLAEKVRPLSLGMAFCRGKEACKFDIQLEHVVFSGDKAEDFDFPIETAASEKLEGLEVEALSEMMQQEHKKMHIALEDGAKVPEEKKPFEGMRKKVHDVLSWFKSKFTGGKAEEKKPEEGAGERPTVISARQLHYSEHEHHHHKGKGKGKGKDDDDDDEDDKSIYVPNIEGICRKCYIRTFKFVMWHSVKMTKKLCEHTKCPVLGKWCEWAGHHREMAYGMLLAKVEPWKYALGRCFHPHHEHPPSPDDPHNPHIHGRRDQYLTGAEEEKAEEAAGYAVSDEEDKGKGKGTGKDDKGKDDKGKGKDEDDKGKGKGKGKPVVIILDVRRLPNPFGSRPDIADIFEQPMMRPSPRFTIVSKEHEEPAGGMLFPQLFSPLAAFTRAVASHRESPSPMHPIKFDNVGEEGHATAVSSSVTHYQDKEGRTHEKTVTTKNENGRVTHSWEDHIVGPKKALAAPKDFAKAEDQKPKIEFTV